MSTNFEDLIMRDTRANQPSAGIPGRLYYVTDENVLERDNGSSWDGVEGAGSGGDLATDTLWGAAGDLVVGTGSAGADTLGAGSEGDLLTIVSGVPAWAAPAGATAAVNNYLLNGGLGIFQRQDPASATARADAAYGPDRWYVLTQTGTVTVERVAGESYGRYQARLKQTQSSAQRMGLAQVLEASDSVPLRGRTVTFGLRVTCSANQAIRVAILEWTGTADSPTKDVVNDWTDSAFTAGHFFLGSNLTVAGVDALTPSAATATTISVTAAISTSCNNLIVMVWTEGTAAQNVTLDLGQARLVASGSLTEWLPRPHAVELAACQRYFQRIQAAGSFSVFASLFVVTTTIARAVIHHAHKRIVPILAFSTANLFAVALSASNYTATALSTGGAALDATWIQITVASGLTVGQGGMLVDNNSTSATIDFEAEL